MGEIVNKKKVRKIKRIMKLTENKNLILEKFIKPDTLATFP